VVFLLDGRGRLPEKIAAALGGPRRSREGLSLPV